MKPAFSTPHRSPIFWTDEAITTHRCKADAKGRIWADCGRAAPASGAFLCGDGTTAVTCLACTAKAGTAPGMTDVLNRSPVLLTCPSCKHVWPIFWYPCHSDPVPSVSKQVVCPWCGVTDRFFHIAHRPAGDLERYAAWLETELVRARKAAADG